MSAKEDKISKVAVYYESRDADQPIESHVFEADKDCSLEVAIIHDGGHLLVWTKKGARQRRRAVAIFHCNCWVFWMDVSNE